MPELLGEMFETVCHGTGLGVVGIRCVVPHDISCKQLKLRWKYKARLFKFFIHSPESNTLLSNKKCGEFQYIILLIYKYVFNFFWKYISNHL
jgi:hypothetical protein